MKFALEQLKLLSLTPTRPLIITDADEVILHFSDILADYLRTQGMYVDFVSYALDGNVKYLDSDLPVDSALFKGLIDDFFHGYVEKQPLVEGTADHLANLSALCDIVILTNIPHDFADRRRSQLIDHGLDYPMVSSSGPKGPVLRAIRDFTREKMIFIDDISHHHASVAKYVPDCLRIQFIANSHLNRIEGKASDCHVRCDDWVHIEQEIRSFLEDE